MTPATAPAADIRTSWEARSGPCVGTLSLSGRSVGLADELMLTLSVEGPADLKAEVARVAGPLWQARSGTTVVEALPAGRQRWTHTAALRPLHSGEVPLPTVEVKTAAGVLRWEPVVVRVTTVRDPANPGTPRPVTGIDPAPPPSPHPIDWFWPAAALAAGLLVVALLRPWALARRRPAPLLPHDRALTSLTEAADANTVAATLRAFVGERFGVPAANRTGEELVAVVPEELREEFAAVVAACDASRFGPPGTPLPESTRLRAREWVMRASCAGQGKRVKS